MTISKILVAHDFSDGASRALRFAAGVARQTGATVEVAYVLPDIYDGRGEPSLALPDALPGQGERYLHFLEEELTRVAERVAGDLVPPIAAHVLRGDPVKRLESFAQELGADAVCLGITGKGAVQRVLLGSISQLVLRSATIPVLLVP